MDVSEWKAILSLVWVWMFDRVQNAEVVQILVRVWSFGQGTRFGMCSGFGMGVGYWMVCREYACNGYRFIFVCGILDMVQDVEGLQILVCVLDTGRGKGWRMSTGFGMGMIFVIGYSIGKMFRFVMDILFWRGYKMWKGYRFCYGCGILDRVQNVERLQVLVLV